ncbi:HPr family phosphocarrier protein [Savagea sp. SN6]|uniref:HPr family phosphocarrier protein n=1 Tax=Savagea serpentis TaxID=2785297 RepID=A0A8J7GCL8_9BACL|nr:HPr family phosphocarrier protein [Savagea serpentis]MBF4501231.1 HPr family phosphocarrier protein [Savagea serpentis]
MREIETTVQMKTGLQARQAALFVQVANRFAADIFLEKDGRRVNAKSIMGVMSLAIARGTTIKLLAEGADDEKALEELRELVESEE